MNLFKKKLSVSSVPQTGYIWKGVSPTDRTMGTDFGPVTLPSGDWSKYLPSPEAQSVPFTFDTKSCTTFSALNTLEMLFNLYIEQGKFSDHQITYMQISGYFDAAGKINFSDRFTAIMSGTSLLGNDSVSVFDSIRNQGLLPERDLPFGGKNWEEYHDKNNITEAMRAKAIKFVDIIVEVTYAWAFVETGPVFRDVSRSIARDALTRAPLQIGIKYPATHAIVSYAMTSSKASIFDSYDPYTYKYLLSEPIHFGMKPAITVKPVINYPVYTFARTLHTGIFDNKDVKMFQSVLFLEGFLQEKYITGNFLALTKEAAMKWQAAHHLLTDGVIGQKSIKVLNELCKTQ